MPTAAAQAARPHFKIGRDREGHWIAVETHGPGFTELTEAVRRFVAGSGIRTGLATLFCRHSSASLLIGENADPDVRREYIVRAWDKMLVKWRDAGAIREAFADGTPLEGWRTALNELYGLNLSKTSPYTGRTEIP